MQEAEKTFRILQEALEKAVKFFSIGVTVDGVPLTQQQAVDVLDVYDTLLDAEEPESYDTRRYFLCRSLECGFMRFLAEILTQPFQHLHEFDAQVTQPFLPLRMKAIKALQRLLLACSEMGEDSCVSCFRVAVEEEIIPLLLRALSESPYEPLRLGAAETLFIFILRISHGRTGFVSTGGRQRPCVRSLMGDGHHTVRSMCASILRELVNTPRRRFNNPATVKVILKSLEDTSADVSNSRRGDFGSKPYDFVRAASHMSYRMLKVSCCHYDVFWMMTPVWRWWCRLHACWRRVVRWRT
ncbi:hypothetical protein C4B63_112g45 [Trypanosoma cruzi]|uniref:Uncharacterized protein n=1 Tax=Trypanosoma cruzi TaxID=5693 RepID=A0A2V2UR79_TRYCR|nr:hypothetical protein C4B63_112g45 [Trypanosoma cruzi]